MTTNHQDETNPRHSVTTHYEVERQVPAFSWADALNGKCGGWVPESGSVKNPLTAAEAAATAAHLLIDNPDKVYRVVSRTVRVDIQQVALYRRDVLPR
jgi:hypothetical protein